MAYVNPNFKTKKEFKEAVEVGDTIGIYQPNSDLTGAQISQDGIVYIEGPHFPAPHTWYAVVTLENGLIVKVE